MKQMSLGTTGFELTAKHTREFFDEMNLVIPCSELLVLMQPDAPSGKTGRPPFTIEVMLRIHLLQQLFVHSCTAMEEKLHNIPLYRDFARSEMRITHLPDESTILRFRHLLEEHGLGQQILATVNVKLIKHGRLLKMGKQCHVAIRAKVEYPFRVSKWQLGHLKVPEQPRWGEKCVKRGLSKQQLMLNLAGYNLVRMRSWGRVRPETVMAEKSR